MWYFVAIETFNFLNIGFYFEYFNIWADASLVVPEYLKTILNKYRKLLKF